MKKIRVEEAVGMVLAHDITRIIPGKFKGVGFKKGHIVQQEDIPELRKIGKQHLFVLNLTSDQLHEDDAALRIANAISGEALRWTQPSEGKSNIISETDGLLKVNSDGLLKINMMGDIIVATLKNNYPCKKDQIVAATRIIPLTIPRHKIVQLETISAEYQPITTVIPYRVMKIGAVVTGSEFYNGLAVDKFDSYIGKKIRDYGSSVIKKINVPDNSAAIADAIGKLKKTDELVGLAVKLHSLDQAGFNHPLGHLPREEGAMMVQVAPQHNSRYPILHPRGLQAAKAAISCLAICRIAL